MKLFKPLLIILSITIMMVSLNVSVYADTAWFENGISPFYAIPQTVQSSLLISNNTAECYSKASGTSISHVTVVQTLEHLQGSDWYPVVGASWSKNSSSTSITFTNSKSDLSSGTYRVKSVFTFTNSKGETETVTEYSSEKTC